MILHEGHGAREWPGKADTMQRAMIDLEPKPRSADICSGPQVCQKQDSGTDNLGTVIKVEEAHALQHDISDTPSMMVRGSRSAAEGR